LLSIASSFINIHELVHPRLIGDWSIEGAQTKAEGERRSIFKGKLILICS
jgi:hypothetical protein